MTKYILHALLLITMLAGFSYGEELLLNGDFQIGVPEEDKPASFECKWWRRELWADDAWNSWLTDGTLDGQIGAGNQALQYRWGATSIYQHFSAAPGETYFFSVDFYNAGDADNRWQPRMQVEWFDSSDNRIGGTITTAEADVPNDPIKTWTTLSGDAVAPAATAYARIMLNVNNRGDGNYWQSMYLDNASVTGVPGIKNLPCSFISAPYDLTLTPINESTLYNDTLTHYADDKDGNALSFTPVSAPAWLTIGTNGIMSGTPQFSDAGNNELVITVDDGNGSTDTRTLTLPVVGYLRTANVFDDDMVLQRGAPIPVWGKAVANTPVTVTMSTGESAATAADANGDWTATLPAMSASTNGAVTMTVTSGSRELQVTNVLVGDVWLCSGQSNMAFDLGSSDDSATEIAAATYPNLRHVNTPATKGTSPWDDLDARAVWQECTPTVAGNFSAIAYYFGKELMLDQNIPIGLINSSQGGSSIRSWAPSLSTPGTETLYNSKIHPYTHMPIRGVIWYQAEANVGDGSAYTPKMQTLVDEWRTVWGASAAEFPFYFVQIAPYDYPSYSEHVLPEMWEAQTKAMRLITNSGMAVINDIGNIANIHPKNKGPVGERLALWAKYGTYGQTSLVHSGPLAREVNREGSQLRVSFDHVGSGLIARDAQPLDWFEVAGEDQAYVAATAVVAGNTLLVSAPSVADPEWVRFAWSEIAEPNLMNAEGLPANAFMLRRIRPRPFRGELLHNRGFENGTVEGWMPTNFNLPPWQRDITGGDIRNTWLTDDTSYPVIGSGNQALINRWANTYAYQDFDVTAGEDYDFSVDTLSNIMSNQWQAVMKVAWFDSANAVIGSQTTLDELAIDAPADTWLPMVGTATAPADAVKGRIILTVAATGSSNYKFVFFDNASVVGTLDGITYENWTLANCLTETSVDDGDSATLLEEYAFNLDPSLGDAQRMVPTIGTNGLPKASFTAERLQVEYLRRRDAPDLDYRVEVSTNLVDWTAVPPVPSIDSINNEWERVVENDTILAADASTARFIRIQIQKN